MTEYEWERACVVDGMWMSDAERAAGAPDAMEVQRLCALQCCGYVAVDYGTRVEVDQDALALERVIHCAIERGTLTASVRSHWVSDRRPLLNALAVTSEPGRSCARLDYHIIERAAFRDFLAAQGIRPSYHIRAWLRPLEREAEAHQEQTAPKKRGRKATDAPALLAQILDALESYATSTGQAFDILAMPGPLGESAAEEGSFHWLAARLCPGAFTRAPSTFARYRAGLCALAPYAKPTDFYRRALPHIAPKFGFTLNVHHMPSEAKK